MALEGWPLTKLHTLLQGNFEAGLSRTSSPLLIIFPGVLTLTLDFYISPENNYFLEEATHLLF